MPSYVISEELRGGLINYLGNQPYKDVAEGVQALNNAKSLDDCIAEAKKMALAKVKADDEQPIG